MNEFSSQYIKGFWENQSDKWTTTGSHFLNHESPEQKRAIETSLSYIIHRMLDSEENILDLGSGGAPQVYLPQELMARTVAVDISETALKRNKAKGKVAADIRDSLPFKDDSFGFVTMFFVHRYIPHPTTFMREVHRLLKTGSEFVAIDYSHNGIETEISEFRPNGLLPELESIGFKSLRSKEIFPEVDFTKDWGFSRGALYLVRGEK